MQRRTSLAALAALLSGCLLPGVSTAPADAPDELAALGPNVVILAAPERDVDAIVGALIDPDTGGPLATRALVVPAYSESSGYLTYDGVREIRVGTGGGVALGPLDGDFAAESITHVGYHVTVSETVFLAGEQLYDSRSGCCEADGGPSEDCAAGYVVRAWVGSGSFHYLARTSAGGDLSGGAIETYGDAVFSVARERYFSSAVFAIEVAPSAPVCERAFCDETDASDRCVRCRTLGMATELGSVSAPADDLLEVACAGMPAGPARATVRGEVVVECAGGATATLALTAHGAEIDRVELVSPASMSSPLSFVRTLDGLTPSTAGSLGASLDLVDCRCGESSARCRLDRELELAVETSPW